MSALSPQTGALLAAASRLRRRLSEATADGHLLAGSASILRRPSLLVAGAAALGVGVLAVAWLAPLRAPARNVAVEVELPPAGSAPATEPSATAAGAPLPPAGQRGSEADTIAEARPDPSNALSVPAVTAAAFAQIPPAPRGAALPRAPVPALVEDTAAGPLPRRGDDGRVAWQAYARPFPARDERPRIAIIVTGLGASAIATREVIRRLPAEVTLAFAPFTAGAAEWAAAARAGGHEILLGLPVQGAAFPFVDKGPDALATNLSAEEGQERLKRLLGRITGYVGVVAELGTGDAEGDAMIDVRSRGPVATAAHELDRRGLLLVGPPGTAELPEAFEGGAPRINLDLTLGGDQSIAALRARLAALEALAKSRSYAVALAEPSPLTVRELSAWAATLAEKNLALAPISAIAVSAGGRAR